MRIFVGGISNETNTFSPVLMDIAQFKKAIWLEGEEMVNIKSNSKETSGTWRYLESLDDVEIVPDFVAHGVTAGPVKKEDYHYMRELLLSSLEQALPVDGVVLNMHGAMQSEDCFDCEGDIFAAVREIVGDDVPITSSFDLHAAISPQIVDCLDGMAAFMTYPHTDHAQTGAAAAKACVDLVRKGIKPEKLYLSLPLILAVENCNTESGPIEPVMEMTKKLLAHPDVLSGALNLTQPWLDVPDLGCQMTLFLRPGADKAALEAEMEHILAYLWEHRKDFEVDVPGIEEALHQAESETAPVCISELGDIVSAGGSSDSTVGLAALLARPDLRPACVTVMDASTVAKAMEVGIGNRGDFVAGGKENHGFNAPVSFSATVLFNSDAKIAPQSNSEKGMEFDMGMRVTLKTDDDLYIIVSEYPNYNHDAAMMTSMNVDPKEMRIIMQKTHQMFKEGYRGIMGSALYADTEGFTDRNIPRLPFKNVRRPLYPLDEISGTPIQKPLSPAPKKCWLKKLFCK